MAKRIIKCRVNDEYVVGSGVPIGAAGSHDDVILRLEFNETWDGLYIYATFRDALGGHPTVVLLLRTMLADGESRIYEVTVPAAAKLYAGKAMFTLTGYLTKQEETEDGIKRTVEDSATNTATAYFPVLPSDYAFAEDGSIDASLAEQLQDEITRHEAEVDDELSAMQATLDAKLEEHKDATAAEIAAHKVEVDGALEAQDIKIGGALEKATLAEFYANNAKNVVDELEARADAGEFKGEQGEPGKQGPQGAPGVIKFIPVTELPTEDIKEGVIYLLRLNDPQEPNMYDEYIYVDGVWEKLGNASVQIDLEEYVKKTDVATAASGTNTTEGILGLTRYISPSYGGLSIEKNGCVKLYAASNPKANRRKGIEFNAVTTAYFNDFLIEAFAGDTYQLVLTDEQKAAVLKLLGVDDTVAAHETAINEALSAQDEVIGGAVDQAAAAQQNAQEALNTANELKADPIPDYWQTHLEEKIATIKALQGEGGKDCFSFVVMTDMHYPSNLGKRSPTIAKRILDKCDIRYVLALGDFQNRSVYNTKDEADAEWGNIRTMLEPIKENVLMVKGNHDGSWGVLNGSAYAYNFTPGELYNRIYALTYKHQNAVADESGTAYYVDDTARKVRFVMLNTQCNPYEKNEDGSAKYNNMTHARFTQIQFDFLTGNALVTIPSDDWNVIICGHHPLWEAELKDANVMLGVLNAYKTKTTYSGEYAGTAEGESIANYTNLLDENGDGFLWGYLGSDDLTEHPVTEKTRMITNKIPVTFNKTTPNVVRFSGAQGYITHVKLYQSDGTTVQGYPNWVLLSNYPNDFVFDENGIMSWNAGQFNDYLSTTQCGELAYVRFVLSSGNADMDLNTMAVTVNEEIVEVSSSGGGYDAVSVNSDFSEAKGNLVGYFCGHNHTDMAQELSGVRQVITRCDARQENTDDLKAERVEGTTTEQSFDVFTVNKAKRKIYATKIGAGTDREIGY